MNWLRQNGFRFLITLIVVIFGILFFYTKQADKLIFLKENCRIIGEKYDKEFSTQTFSEGKNPTISNYTYSKKNGACVFSAGQFNASTGIYNFVRDLDTNRILAEYSTSFSSDMSSADYQQYLKAKKEIFNDSLSNEEQALLDQLKIKYEN